MTSNFLNRSQIFNSQSLGKYNYDSSPNYRMTQNNNPYNNLGTLNESFSIESNQTKKRKSRRQKSWVNEE